MEPKPPCDPPDQPCVLVVDDDADLVAFLFSVLVEERFSIVAASDGQQAFDLLEHGLRPHVIVLDLLLPRVSGFDLLAHIASDPALRTIPRIVITGTSERGAIGADAVFGKPFDHNELLAEIRRLVGGDSNNRPIPTSAQAVADDRPRRRKPRTGPVRPAR